MMVSYTYGNSALFLQRSQYISFDFYVKFIYSEKATKFMNFTKEVSKG